MEIRNKVAIVTGASSGIGEAVARLLTQKGARVALIARSKGKLIKISRELPGSFVVACDMSDPEDIKRMVKKVAGHYKRIDILVNNAGRGYNAMIESINLKIFKQLFDLNLVGPLVAIQQVIPFMKENKKGSIVNISSGTALKKILTGVAAYSSLKCALSRLSLTAREELKPFGINVGVVYPYITATDFKKNTIKNKHAEKIGSDIYDGADRAEFAAEKVVWAIEKEDAEVFAHDWMGGGK